ncbi:MAG: hypothetical protein JWN14_5148 [Chthonomonadales bacterium]|nr:hypothetical protein [Chthonomonadales bacterium]
MKYLQIVLLCIFAACLYGIVHDQITARICVEVEDLKSYLEKAVALGGKTLVPPIQIPTGHFAWLSDPDGNVVGLLQPKKP